MEHVPGEQREETARAPEDQRGGRGVKNRKLHDCGVDLSSTADLVDMMREKEIYKDSEQGFGWGELRVGARDRHDGIHRAAPGLA
ncbi:hypothetical protein C8T65DRAFT_647012 [Cerioporus squamosus]|nr:hypothetical protein C8T65DRAFT_647012 [Cerioporus squamosus]